RALRSGDALVNASAFRKELWVDNFGGVSPRRIEGEPHLALEADRRLCKRHPPSLCPRSAPGGPIGKTVDPHLSARDLAVLERPVLLLRQLWRFRAVISGKDVRLVVAEDLLVRIRRGRIGDLVPKDGRAGELAAFERDVLSADRPEFEGSIRLD